MDRARRLLTLLVLIILLVAPVNPSVYTQTDNHGLLVVVSFPNLVYDIEPLLCSGDRVVSIAPAGVDPHEYQLTPDDVGLLEEADVIISTAHAPFEEDIRRLAEKGEVRAVLVEIPSIPGINILENPVTGQPNYHMPIYDPWNYKVFINYTAHVMAEKNPLCIEQYLSKARSIIAEIDNIVNTIQKIDVIAVADTPVTQYAVSWLGIDIEYLMIKEHGIPATPDDIYRIEKAMAGGEIGVAIVLEPTTLPASQQLVEMAKTYNIPVLKVKTPTSQESILEKIKYIVSQASSLKKETITPGKQGEKAIPLTSYLVGLSGALATILFGLGYLWVGRRGLYKTMGVGALIATIALSFLLGIHYIPNPLWVIVMVSVALAYGVLSPVVAARRLYFLAAASPHVALFAAVASIPLAYTTIISNQYFWIIVIGIALTYIVGYMIHRGIDPDTATASFVAFTASASVIAIYYVLTRFPIATDITTLIIGDPLLVSIDDVAIASGIALVTVSILLLTYREQICMGVDRDSVKLSGINTKIYDLVVFTLLAVTTVVLIRIVGFVLEHVLILLPASIAVTLSNSAGDTIVYSILFSLLASLLGLYLAVTMNLAPAGITGLVLTMIYVGALLTKKR
ncbi:MAG: metal ABC transporter permease [Desulfurococcales archaeon]|nr:metal ABC transporter permease [Desulfurococcales archaeon]